MNKLFLFMLVFALAFNGCSDKKEAEKLTHDLTIKIKKATAAHKKVISDRDALDYRAQLLNARAQGLITAQSYSAALTALKEQERLLPPLVTADRAKVAAAVKLAQTTPAAQSALDAIDFYRFNSVLKMDTRAADSAEAAVMPSVANLGNQAVKTGAQVDQDKSWFGLGGVAHWSGYFLKWCLAGLVLVIVGFVVFDIFFPPAGVAGGAAAVNSIRFIATGSMNVLHGLGVCVLDALEAVGGLVMRSNPPQTIEIKAA